MSSILLIQLLLVVVVFVVCVDSAFTSFNIQAFQLRKIDETPKIKKNQINLFVSLENFRNDFVFEKIFHMFLLFGITKLIYVTIIF